MWTRRISRRRLLALSGAALAAKVFKVALAESADDLMRIGFVLPTRTGGMLRRHDSYEIAGEAARRGAVLGSEVFGLEAEVAGKRLDVLVSTAPTEDAAFRAGQRLATIEETFALVGGFGAAQAMTLSRVAHENQVVFLNIGALSDALRNDACSPFTFHLEASAAMYLDATADWFAHAGHLRWFFVYVDSDEGVALYHRALKALSQLRQDATEVGSAAISAEAPVYTEALRSIRESEPDVVLLLLNWLPQLDFLGQYEAMGITHAVAGLPDPVAQTREFFDTSRNVAPKAGSGHRAVLWETTLDAHGARELNERFTSRWGEPLDSSAWAAYQAVKILFEAALSSGTLEGAGLVSYLESSEATFDVQKGVDVSFRPWNHQLRQPLYLVKIDPEAEPGRELSRKLAWANLVTELPLNQKPNADPVERLDQLGDGPSESRCRF